MVRMTIGRDSVTQRPNRDRRVDLQAHAFGGDLKHRVDINVHPTIALGGALLQVAILCRNAQIAIVGWTFRSTRSAATENTAWT